MILDNKSLEKLSAEALASLAVVLFSIKAGSENNVLSNGVKTFPLEFKFGKYADIPFSRDNIKAAETAKAEIMKYLISQGAIQDYSQQPPQVSPLGRRIRPDFLVTIKPKVFDEFFNKAMPFALSHGEATLMNQGQSEAVQAHVVAKDEHVKGESINTNPRPYIDLGNLKLNDRSYDKYKGILHLDPFHEIKFVKKGKVKRANGTTYEQPRLLECVFKSVNTLNSGVLFSTVLGVHKDNISQKHQRKIENTVSEINKKAEQQMGVKNLIKIQGNKVVLNNSYL